MVNRAYLRPRSVDNPPQGDFQYSPAMVILEDTTQAGLQAQLVSEFNTNAQDMDRFWVIEQVEYTVVVTNPATGVSPAKLLYSVLVWATKAEKV